MLPPWLDRNEYPFIPKQFTLPMGQMSYVDEGGGEPIVMVHGNPVWSFVYRHLITGLNGRYRCIAMDHIGFGLSDKPEDWTYRPQDHAANLQTFLDALDLSGITLVVQDWGGPIGLAYAIHNPERVRRLIILNTWLWPVNDDWYYRAFSGFMGGVIGRFLIRRFNFFARSVVRTAYGDKRKLTPHIHAHYLNHLPTPQSRKGSWVFPGQIIGATDWLAQLWAQRAQLADKPALLAWGMKDIAFREKELRRWIALFPKAAVTRYPDAGHYVQDEKGPELAVLIAAFMNNSPEL
jgi:haloalkane dehalogenase